MPSAARVMLNWCVDMTWTPEPGVYAPLTRPFKIKAAAGQSAFVLSAAQSATVDMNAKAPVTLSAPYFDPDQSW